jgi:hypothetical protein
MRGGWTMVASPARPTYVYAQGVSPLWLARVRRLLTEHANADDATTPTIDVHAWRQLEGWAAEAHQPVSRLRAGRDRIVRRLRALPAEAEGA